MTTGSPTVDRVLRGELCSGCGLCAGVEGSGLALTTVAPGYTRPVGRGPTSPDAERMIAAACPGAKVEPWQDAPQWHPYWGPAHRVLAGHATDPAVRHAGSSGAALTMLAIHALRDGRVDGVLHVVADPDHPTRNLMRLSHDPEEVLAGAGSRYAASSPLAQIDSLLGRGGRFVFIGKPCDVSALRRLATVDSRVDQLVPYMFAFFCAGVPSHDGADRIVRQMGLDPQALTAFRYRGNGWPGLTVAQTADGRVGEMTYAQSWGGQLSKQVQFRCKICPDAVGGVADIAAADAWYGGDSGYPEFEEQDGRSLILTRTARGNSLLDSAIRAGDMLVEPIAYAEIDRMQPAQARRKRQLTARLAACAATLQPRPVMRGLALSQAARRAPFSEKLKTFAGTARRIIKGQR